MKNMYLIMYRENGAAADLSRDIVDAIPQEVVDESLTRCIGYRSAEQLTGDLQMLREMTELMSEYYAIVILVDEFVLVTETIGALEDCFNNINRRELIIVAPASLHDRVNVLSKIKYSNFINGDTLEQAVRSVIGTMGASTMWEWNQDKEWAAHLESKRCGTSEVTE